MNVTFVDYADFINVAMPIYNLTEYSDNYSDTSGSSWGFKRDKVANNADMANEDNAPSFKYKANLIDDPETNGTKKRVKIAVPLKYLTDFWRSLEMPLINCKVNISLKWIENCVLIAAAVSADVDATDADSATFKITDAKLHVPVATLSAEGNVKLTKQLNKGFKRSLYQNKYKVIDNKKVEITNANEEKPKRELLDSSYQGVKRLLFVLIYDNNQVSVNSFKNYFFPRVKIENYNIVIDGRNVYDQPINDSIKQQAKSEKYQQDKMTIIQQAVSQILLISKKNTD